MKGEIQNLNWQLVEEKKELQLDLQGILKGQYEGNTIRIMAVFQGKDRDRRYPVVAKCQSCENGDTAFSASVRIQLEYVFFQYQRGQEQEIILRFAWCDWKEKWVESDKTIVLPADLFESRRVKKGTGKRILCGIAYVFYTLCLPVWLLDGYLALKGHRKLHTAARGMTGKKAILYHAHGIVYERTGYGYSIREIKTNYFRKQYERACKRILETEGVLLLSERRMEPGGNLDLVRRQLAKSRECTVSEFLTTRPVHKLTWQELKQSAAMIAAAKIVVLEDFYPQLHALDIRKDTRIIQLWHACGAFKLFGLSELGLVSHLEQSTRNHRNYNVALTSSEGIAPFYSEAFGISDRCVRPIGIPRTDIFFDRTYQEQIRRRLYEKYPVCHGKKVVLFAPTFRGSGNKTAYFPKEKFPVNEIIRKLPEDTVLILKQHPFVKLSYEVDAEYQSRVLDLSQQENINDLLFITSLLITDYSSVIFEAALLQLPMLFYVFDLSEYLESRNLYFDFASFVPGEIVETKEQLVEKIKEQLAVSQQEKHMDALQQEKYQEFCRFFLGALDGKSTERTGNLILALLEENEG